MKTVITVQAVLVYSNFDIEHACGMDAHGFDRQEFSIAFELQKQLAFD